MHFDVLVSVRTTLFMMKSCKCKGHCHSLCINFLSFREVSPCKNCKLRPMEQRLCNVRKKRCFKKYLSGIFLTDLNTFGAMFPFLTPENIRKSEVSWCFQGGYRKETFRWNVLSSFLMAGCKETQFVNMCFCNPEAVTRRCSIKGLQLY